MHFHFSFYSSLLLIVFSQGVLFSALLLWRGYRHADKPSRWLSLFIFLCSLFILPWMLGHAGWYSLQPYRDILFYVPTQQQLLIGPVIYFYTQSLLNPSFRMGKVVLLHCLPAALYAVYSLLVFLTDKVVLHRYFFYANGRDKDLDTWYQIAGLTSMVVYGLLAIRYYALYKKVIYRSTSFAGNLLFDWVKKYLFAFFIMQAIMLGLWIFYPQWGSFTQKWWYYFLFACTYYYIALAAYANQVKAVVSFLSPGWMHKEIYLLPVKTNHFPGKDEKDEPQRLTWTEQTDAGKEDEELIFWKEKLGLLFEKEKLYHDPELTLSAVAAKAGTNVAVVSRVINGGFARNFNDYVNGYRVAALLRLFAKGEHKRQTLLSLAFECGFNSKTTFNRAFKKSTGVSPRQYLTSLNKQPASPAASQVSSTKERSKS